MPLTEPYDKWVDTIICSKDFEVCPYRNMEDSICNLGDSISKCWHISKCPVGYGRDNPNKTTAELKGCPLDGDESNDCDGCVYSGDYHFVNGECLRRRKTMVKIDSWRIIMTTETGEDIELVNIPDEISDAVDEEIEKDYEVTWEK